jgi:hypothetical protein
VTTRRFCAVAAVVTVLIAQTLLLAGAADAQGPDQVGWWSEVQQAPTPLPVNTATGNNLMVGNDPTGPNAIAAVRFTVRTSVDGASVDPSTVPATLTLHVVANSAVGNPAVVACPVLINWQPASGGSWSSRPNYTCSPSVTARFSASGDTATFNLTPALQRDAGLYDLALTPAPGNTDPWSVQFQSPGADALALGAGSSPATDAAPAASDAGTSTEPLSDTSAVPAPDLSAGPGLIANPALPIAPAPAATPATTARPTTSTPGFFRPRLAKVSAKRAQRALAFGVLLAIAAALWWFGGQPARSPRLLGSLGEGRDDDAGEGGAASPVYLVSGGIGRFARPRTGPPPRL